MMLIKDKLINGIYYDIRPAIPRRLQLALRRLMAPLVAKRHRDIWPINEKASMPPAGWKGWPNNKKFAFVLTHDVDSAKGEQRCLDLMKLDKEAGVKSAFYFVPANAPKSASIIPELKKNGFEIGVHGLLHNGKLFRSKKRFQESAVVINLFLRRWEAIGFRGDCMHRNLDWIQDLDILYDASTFDVDPFEPQPEGMTTIFPFQVKNPILGKSFIELPYTLPQDFLLFVIMRKKNIDIWKKKLDWIAGKSGMAMLITHPDYMSFEGSSLAVDEYRVSLYMDFLEHLKHAYGGLFWNALPSEVARYWASNY